MRLTCRRRSRSRSPITAAMRCCILPCISDCSFPSSSSSFWSIACIICITKSCGRPSTDGVSFAPVLDSVYIPNIPCKPVLPSSGLHVVEHLTCSILAAPAFFAALLAASALPISAWRSAHPSATPMSIHNSFSDISGYVEEDPLSIGKILNLQVLQTCAWWPRAAGHDTAGVCTS